MITEEVYVPYIAGPICNGIQFAIIVYGTGVVCVLGLGAGAGGLIMIVYVSRVVVANCRFRCVTAQSCIKERPVAK